MIEFNAARRTSQWLKEAALQRYSIRSRTSESKRSFWWKMEVDDPGVIIAPVGMISCTQTEEQAFAGSNVSKNVT